MTRLLSGIARPEGLAVAPGTCLVTGVAGFLGGHLRGTQLGLGQRVVGPDKIAADHRRKLAERQHRAGERAWARFHLIESALRRPAHSLVACAGIDFVLRRAARRSVPRRADTLLCSADAFINGNGATRHVIVAGLTKVAARYSEHAGRTTAGA